VELISCYLAIAIFIQQTESLPDRESVVRKKDFLQSLDIAFITDNLTNESQKQKVLNLAGFCFFLFDLLLFLPFSLSALLVFLIFAFSLSSFGSEFLC